MDLDGIGVPTVAVKSKLAVDAMGNTNRKKKIGSAKNAAKDVSVRRTWWEQWDEDEFSRTKSYDRNMPLMPRFARAAVDFKKGRPWPHTLHNLWDQFRLYTGLLSQPNACINSKHSVTNAKSPAKRSSEDKFDWDSCMEKFLQDPETSMKIFFSSYFRDRGLIWAPAHCKAFPILVSFFLRFLIRSKTFWEADLDKRLRRALVVVERACIELPLMARIGAVLPDALSNGLKELWETKRPTRDEKIVGEGAPVVNNDRREGKGEGRPTKRQKRDELVIHSPPKSAEVLQGGATTVTVDAGWGDTSTAGTRRGDVTSVGTGWGNTTGNGCAWGNADNAWGGEGTKDQAPLSADEMPVWGVLRTIFPLLGPTALPLTHTTGVMERSVRRIVCVEPPLQGRLCKKAMGPAAEGVEEELEHRFARVVLSPWRDWDACGSYEASDIEKPIILPTSRGAVVLDQHPDPKVKDLRRKGHSPFVDDICVLMEPIVAKVLEPAVGMGLDATWIEIVRREEEKGRVRYWYMEQLTQQLSSYHME